MVNSLRKRFSYAPLALKDDTFVFYDEFESVLHMMRLKVSPDSPVACHAGARRPRICPALRSQEPACHPPLLLLLLLAVVVVVAVAVVLELAVEAISYPVAPNTVVALSVAHWVP